MRSADNRTLMVFVGGEGIDETWNAKLESEWKDHYFCYKMLFHKTRTQRLEGPVAILPRMTLKSVTSQHVGGVTRT